MLPEWRPKTRQLFEACVRDGVPFDVELQIEGAKGTRKWIRLTAEAVYGAAGEVALEGARGNGHLETANLIKIQSRLCLPVLRCHNPPPSALPYPKQD